MAVCPVCKRLEGIKQLSSAVRSMSGNGEDSVFHPPEYPREPRLERIIGWTLACLLMASGIIIFAVSDALIALFLIIGGFIFLASFLNDERERRARWAERVFEWELANEIWKNLYYCARDDIIFDPDTGTTISPENLDNVLFQNNTLQMRSANSG
jgi:hypothetical protein